MFLTWLSFYEVEGMMMELQGAKDAIVLKNYYFWFIHKETSPTAVFMDTKVNVFGVGTFSVCGNLTGYFRVFNGFLTPQKWLISALM